ncbi:MAG: tyrosine-type recombinase/integrase [Verrucomicrobiales bacterium]
MNDKSGSKVGRHPKTGKRYWQNKVLRRVYRRDGHEIQESDFSVKVQFKGRRYRFVLGSANRATAAARAQKIYTSLLQRGWEATMTEFAPETAKPAEVRENQPTVGQLISVVENLSSARPATLQTYFKAFRKIAGDIHNVKRGKKFDAKKGNLLWRESIDAIPLDSLTPGKVQEWKIGFLRSAGNDPAKQRSAKITVNSLIRNAKTLFAKKHLAYLSEKITLPSPLPFSTVTMEKQPSMRYHSKIDAEAILKIAGEQLMNGQPEGFKILLLSLLCGLRKSEIDTLFWSAFDFEKQQILIEPNEFNPLKSEDSAGEVELDSELANLFRHFQTQATGRFVIESPRKPRNLAVTRNYRAKPHFDGLNEWLRANGVDSDKPLHTLRKEFGALLTARHGIYAASRALRHSDIAITVAHYADKKERTTVGLGSFLPTHRPQ